MKISELENVNRLISSFEVSNNDNNLIKTTMNITSFDVLLDKLMIIGCDNGSIMI